MNELIILFFIAAFLSVIIGTVAGFGTSTIFLPIALIFVDFKTALVLVAISHLSGNVGATTFFRHGLDKRLILLFASAGRTRKAIKKQIKNAMSICFILEKLAMIYLLDMDLIRVHK